MSAEIEGKYDINPCEDEAVNASTRLLSVDSAQRVEDAVNTFRRILNERHLLPPSQDDRGTMLRFLKENGYDLYKAAYMWKGMIKWRRENGVDTIIQEFIDNEYEDLQSYYPQCYHGIDKKGHPIYINCLGKADGRKLKNVTNADRFLRFYIFGFEKAFAEKFPACSGDIDSMTRIVDLDGMHWGDSTSSIVLNIFKRMENINIKYYPQTTHEMFYVNARVGFKMLWGLTKLIARACKIPIGRTHVLGSKFQNKLLEVINEDQLPTFLGGSCTCQGEGGCLRSEKGPWKDPKIMKAKNATLVPNLEQILPEMIHNAEQALPELKDSGDTTLEEKVNALSDKLDNIQATLNQLLVAKQQATN